MGDQQHRHSIAFERAQDVKQAVGLVRCQDARGLVEDQDAGAAPQRFKNLDPLLQPDGQVANDGIRVNLKPVLGAEALELAPGLGTALRQQSATLGPQHDVLEHGEGGHQHEMLMHHADPVRDRVGRASDRNRLARNLDPAGIRRIEAVEDVDEGRLARPVLADDAVDRAFGDFERHIMISAHGAEILVDSAQ